MPSGIRNGRNLNDARPSSSTQNVLLTKVTKGAAIRPMRGSSRQLRPMLSAAEYSSSLAISRVFFWISNPALRKMCVV